MNKLQEAVNKISVHMLENLTYGVELKLNDKFTLSHYLEDEIIVLCETENWTEIYQILYSHDDIVFEILDEEREEYLLK